MKRIVLGIMTIAVLLLIGCNKVATYSQSHTLTELKEKNENSETGKVRQPKPTNYLARYAKTYDDETHKEIKYGKLSFHIGLNHIVSDTFNGNTKIFKCESDKGKVKPVSNMTITVREIKKPDSLNVKSIVSYLSYISPNYDKIKIYNSVADDSGIIGFYSVTGDSLTKYVVLYRDACYLIESNKSNLDAFIFKKLSIEANYVECKQKVKCANSFTTYVNETISYDDKKAEYNIIQGKDGKMYSADIGYDSKSCQFNFILNNDEGKKLLTLSTHASNINDLIKILDVNIDGYADVQFLVQVGAINNNYALYVWSDSTNNFVKVKCDEMLSYFEVHDGYLLNWAKKDAQSGFIQKLVWDKNTLVKQSEEHFQAN